MREGLGTRLHGNKLGFSGVDWLFNGLFSECRVHQWGSPCCVPSFWLALLMGGVAIAMSICINVVSESHFGLISLTLFYKSFGEMDELYPTRNWYV